MDIRVTRRAGESDIDFAKRRLYRVFVASAITLAVGIAWRPFFPVILDQGAIVFLLSGALSFALVLLAVALCLCLVFLVPVLCWFQLESHYPSLIQTRKRATRIGEWLVCTAILAAATFAIASAIVTGKVHQISRTGGGELIPATDSPGFYFFYIALWGVFLLGSLAWLYVLAKGSKRER